GLPYSATVTLGEHPNQLLERVPLAFAKQHQILPLLQRADAIIVALVDPREIFALDDLRLLLGAPIEPVVVPKPALHEALTHAYDQAAQSTQDLIDNLDEKTLDLDGAAWQEPRDLLETDDEAPIIRLVNSLFAQAIKERASDIHVEPFEQELLIRLR